MPCTNESCAAVEGLAVCEFCGHPFCASHRGEQDGLASCTGCLKAAHDQRVARSKPASAPVSSTSDSGRGGPIQVTIPPPPLPEPGGPWILPYAAVATIPAGGYLYWFLGWLSRRHELPGWLPGVGGLLGAAFVFMAVWVIAKSRIAASR